MCDNLFVRQRGECNLLQCDQLQFNEALGNHVRAAGLGEFVQLKAGQAECHAMVVVDAEGKPVVLALADKNAEAGAFQLMRSNGSPLVQMRATDAGGLVTAIGHGGKVLVAMGSEGQNYGVFGQFPQIGPPFPLTSPNRFDIKAITPKSTQTPAPLTPPAPPQQENKPSSGNTP